MTASVGDVFETNNYGAVTLVAYRGRNDCSFEFSDGTVVTGQVGHARNGDLKNPMARTVHGVGYLGQGKYGASSHPAAYRAWNEMLERAYSPAFHARCPTYAGVTVCDEWHCLQSFGSWFDANYVEGFHLDKDLLIEGNKQYSPDACCFVPGWLNTLLISNHISSGSVWPEGVNQKPNGRFCAQVRRYNKNRHIGVYDTPDEAGRAYQRAKGEHILVVMHDDAVPDRVRPALSRIAHSYLLRGRS